MRLGEAVKAYRLELAGGVLLLAAVYYSIVGDMVWDWYHDDNYSHGFLVPLIAGWFFWQDRERILDAAVRPWNPGIFVVLLALCQLVVAWLGTEFFNLRLSLIVLVAGVVLFAFGVEAFKRLRLPLGYLVFMIPIPYLIYDALSFPLKLFVSRVSVGTLRLLNYPVLREGNVILLPNISLEVAEACSGLRSLVSLIALSVAFAFLTQTKIWKRWTIVLAAVPVAIATNALRVIITGVLARHYGSVVAEGFFHEFAGLAIFLLSVAILGSIGVLLRAGEK